MSNHTYAPNDWVYHQTYGVALIQTATADQAQIDIGPTIVTVPTTELKPIAWDAWSTEDLIKLRQHNQPDQPKENQCATTN